MSTRTESERIFADLFRTATSRRELLKRAAALGLAAPALAALAHRPTGAAAQAAPGGNEPKGPQVEQLVFWTRASPDDAGDPNLFKQMQAVAETYKGLVGTTVEFVTVPDADFRNKMSISAPAGEGPDAFGPIAHDWFGLFQAQGIASEIPDAAVQGPQDFVPVTAELTRIDGKLYALPLFLESVALIYNKDMVPEAPTTWDALVSTAAGLTQEPDTYGFGFPLLEQYHEGGFFHGFGSYIFKVENGVVNTEDIGLNNPGGVEAAKFLRDMYHKKQPPMPEAAIDRANQGPAQESMMEQGQLAMTINGPWRENSLTAAGINYGVAKLPTLPNGQPMRPFAGLQGMLVNAYGEQLEASLDFITFLTGTNSAVELFKVEKKVPARLSAQESETVKADPNTAIWAAQLADSVPMPIIPAMQRVWEPWGSAMDAIIPGNAPDDQVQQYLDDAVAQIKAEIAEMQGA